MASQPEHDHPEPSQPPPPRAPAQSRARLAFNLTLGLVFSAVFIWLAVRGVDWGRFAEEAAGMHVWALLGYAVVLSTAQFLRLIRWGLTVRALAPVPWPRILAVAAVGNAAIFMLPARLGELVRPLLIIEDRQLNFGQATATVVVERILDGLTMSAILFGTVLVLDPAMVPQKFLYSGYVAATIFLGASLGLFLAGVTFRWSEGLIEAILGRISRPLADKVLGVVGGFFGALRMMGSLRLGVIYLVLTVIIWALSGVGLWVIFQAFPATTGSLPMVAAFTTLSVLVVGIMIPAGPATVGVFHWAMVFALGMFAVDRSVGLLVATLVHLLIAAINLAFGLVGWVGGRIDVFAVLRRPAPSEALTDEAVVNR